jgi:hypothetical protein
MKFKCVCGFETNWSKLINLHNLGHMQGIPLRKEEEYK